MIWTLAHEAPPKADPQSFAWTLSLPTRDNRDQEWHELSLWTREHAQKANGLHTLT